MHGPREVLSRAQADRIEDALASLRSTVAAMHLGVVSFHHHDLNIVARLDAFESKFHQLARNQEIIMSAIDDLKTQVQRVSDQDQAIITLCQTLSQQLKDALANNDNSAIEDIANQLGAQADAVAAAVSANTPGGGQDTSGGGQSTVTGGGQDTDAGGGSDTTGGAGTGP